MFESDAETVDPFADCVKHEFTDAADAFAKTMQSKQDKTYVHYTKKWVYNPETGSDELVQPEIFIVYTTK